VLVYGAGGLAFGDVKTSYGGADQTPFSNTTQRVGWAVGAGLDYALSNNIIGGVEYRHTDLGQRSFANHDPNIDVYDNVKFTSDAAIVGIRYKF
jgi:outer membrane immunogenic protein